MAKASLTAKDGTIINIDGSVEEIHRLLQLYGGATAHPMPSSKKINKNYSKKGITTSENDQSEVDDGFITKIVNLVKECDEAELIEKNIIDRTSQVDRVLLPLYVVCTYLDKCSGLQSGEISKITKELGIPISQPNVSRTLSKTAARYVMGDKVRKARQAVKYLLNRRGLKYLSAVIQGKTDE